MPAHPSTRRPARLLAAVLGVVAAVGLVGPSVGAGQTPVDGAAGIGDPYYPLDGNGGYDVESYDVRVDYRFGTARLEGDTRIVLTPTQSLSSFSLDLLLPVQSVRVDGEPAAFVKPHPHELRVTPDQALVPGEPVRVRVQYAGRPGGKTYLGEQNWAADDREVVAMNQPHMSPWWFPANDHPQDRATMDVRVTTRRTDPLKPWPTRIIANGERVSRQLHDGRVTERWVADEPMVPYLAFFAAGPFRVASGEWAGGRTWSVAVSKRLSGVETTMTVMKTHDEVAAALADDLGEYPFSTTGGVATALFVQFALENQTRPTYGRGQVSHAVVVHEQAHQWFGDLIAVDRWSDIWLNEGPATFFEEVRYPETTSGLDPEQWLCDRYQSIGSTAPFWDVDISDPGAEIDELFSEPVYERGAMTFQALRNRVGETDFWAILQQWVDVDPMVGAAKSTADFEALAESVSGEELTPFFDAWVTGGAKPADSEANGLACP